MGESFYIADTVYVQAEVYSEFDAGIASVTLSSFTLSDGADTDLCGGPCQTVSDLEYTSLASPANEDRFSFLLSQSFLSGTGTPEGEVVTLSANFEVTYNDGGLRRRRLEQVNVDLSQAFSVTYDPCGEDVETGYVETTTCESDPTSHFVRQCTENGWQVILDQCEEALVAKTENSSPAQDNAVYYVSTGVLIALIAGVVWYTTG